MLDSLGKTRRWLIREYDSLDLVKQGEIVKLELAAQTGTPITIRKDSVGRAESSGSGQDIIDKPGVWMTLGAANIVILGLAGWARYKEARKKRKQRGQLIKR
jgi:hypothetical protein